jgi:hypothetical protein
MSQKFVECGQHGKQEMALICTHLAHSVSGDAPLGFMSMMKVIWADRMPGATNVIWYWIKQKQKMNSMNGLPVVIIKLFVSIAGTK